MALGEYSGLYDPTTHDFLGDTPTNIETILVADQCFDFVCNFTQSMLLMCGGRRSGKTTSALAPKIVICMLLFPGQIGEVLSPTYRQSMNVYRAILRHVPADWIHKKLKAEKTIILRNGAEIKMLSADNEDSARSEGVAYGAYDERQDISEEAYGNAMLSTSEGGSHNIVFETATIKAELRKHYDRVEASALGKTYRADSYGNPFINTAFLDAAKEFLDSELVQREIHADWPELHGRIFWSFDQPTMVQSWNSFGDYTSGFLFDKLGTPPPGAPDCPSNVFVIDPPMTATGYKIRSDETAHLVHEILIGADGKKGDMRSVVKQIQAIDPHAVVIVDPHEKKYDTDITKYLKRAGLHIRSVKPMLVEYKLTSVRARVERQKLLVDPRCTHAIEVLEKHQYLPDGSGRVDKSKCYEDQDTRTWKGSDQIQLVHLSDTVGYFCYRFWPAKVDYEDLERLQDAA